MNYENKDQIELADTDRIKAILAATKQVLADRDLCVLMGIEVPICLDDLAKTVAEVEKLKSPEHCAPNGQ